MGFVLTLIGLLFLANPNISIIDLIPDFIGFLLIYIGLNRLSFLNEDINSARKISLYLLLLNVGKTFCIAFLSPKDATTYLLFPFVFGIAEFLLFYKFAQDYFYGLDYLGVMHSSRSVLLVKKRKLPFFKGRKYDYSTSVKRFFLIFIFVRNLFAILPELVVLDISSSNLTGFYFRYRTVLYIFAVTVVSVFSIIYIVKIIKFFRSIIKDKEFINGLNGQYRQLKRKFSNYNKLLAYQIALIVYIVAAVCSFNPSSEGFITIPAFIPSVLLTVSFLIILKKRIKRIYRIILLIPISVLSYIEITLKNSFYDNFKRVEDIFHFQDAFNDFFRIVFVVIGELFLLLLFFLIVGIPLIKTINNEIMIMSSDKMGLKDYKPGKVYLLAYNISNVYYREFSRKAISFIRINIIFPIIYFVLELSTPLVGYMLGFYQGNSSTIDFMGSLFSAYKLASAVILLIWLISSFSYFSYCSREISENRKTKLENM